MGTLFSAADTPAEQARAESNLAYIYVRERCTLTTTSQAQFLKALQFLRDDTQRAAAALTVEALHMRRFRALLKALVRNEFDRGRVQAMLLTFAQMDAEVRAPLIFEALCSPHMLSAGDRLYVPGKFSFGKEVKNVLRQLLRGIPVVVLEMAMGDLEECAKHDKAMEFVIGRIRTRVSTLREAAKVEAAAARAAAAERKAVAKVERLREEEASAQETMDDLTQACASMVEDGEVAPEHVAEFAAKDAEYRLAFAKHEHATTNMDKALEKRERRGGARAAAAHKADAHKRKHRLTAEDLISRNTMPEIAVVEANDWDTTLAIIRNNAVTSAKRLAFAWCLVNQLDDHYDSFKKALEALTPEARLLVCSSDVLQTPVMQNYPKFSALFSCNTSS
jgi:hypothetical protein